MLTDYQCYRSMTWTTDSDECEAGCGAVMSEGAYAEGALGHYCSAKCRSAEESGDSEPAAHERRAMGVSQ
jgi:hypothetical protein